MINAHETYQKVLDNFCLKHDSYHKIIIKSDSEVLNLVAFVNTFFN